MNACVCCHSRLLHHLKQRRSYWFCPSCNQEMPNLLVIKAANEIINSAGNISSLSDSLQKKSELVSANQ